MRDRKNAGTDEKNQWAEMERALLGTVISIDFTVFSIRLNYSDGRHIYLEPLGWEAEAIGVDYERP